MGLEGKSVIKGDITWGGDDPFTHTLIVGPTRCGKSATLILPTIYQILEEKAKGKQVGLTVIEPKGDIVRKIKKITDAIGEEMVYIDPEFPEESDTINVMNGKKADVAEATVAVLKSMFGKQEAFFQSVQELSTRNVTLLLKELYGDDMYITDVLHNLRDQLLLEKNVEKLRRMNKASSQGILDFFDNELGGQDGDHFRKLILGLRAQLENLTSNEVLSPIITKKSSVNLDEHYAKGGIMGVNTALGSLGQTASDAFGQFVAMHAQLATYRRPGTEDTRIPHYLIIDEFSRYINPNVETFLSIAAEYRVAGILAVQSLGQLELEAGKTTAQAMKRAIMTSTRNKFVFGGLSNEDAQEISLELGKNSVRERQEMMDGNVLKGYMPKMTRVNEIEKDRFTYTELMDALPRFHYVAKLLQDGFPQKPIVGVGQFVPRDMDAVRDHFQKIKENPVDAVITKPDILEEEIPAFNIKKRFLRFKQQHEYELRKQLYKEHLQKVRNEMLVNPFDGMNLQSFETTVQKPDHSQTKANDAFQDQASSLKGTVNPSPDEKKQEKHSKERESRTFNIKSFTVSTQNQESSIKPEQPMQESATVSESPRETSGQAKEVTSVQVSEKDIKDTEKAFQAFDDPFTQSPFINHEEETEQEENYNKEPSQTDEDERVAEQEDLAEKQENDDTEAETEEFFKF